MGIYDDIGGPEAVRIAVDDFYERVLGDPALSPYFTGVDMTRLTRHQRSFIAAALGGPEIYRGRSMAEAHAHLHIEPDHVDRVVGHLADTLTKLGVSGAVVEQIGAKLAPLKADIAASPATERAVPGRLAS